MARKAIIAKEKRRERAGLHAKVSREKLRAVISDSNTGYDERMAAVVKLNKKPRNQSLTRRQRRCELCGRAHGVYRLFGLCRLCLRKYAMRGLVPGVEKSSW